MGVKFERVTKTKESIIDMLANEDMRVKDIHSKFDNVSGQNLNRILVDLIKEKRIFKVARGVYSIANKGYKMSMQETRAIRKDYKMSPF